MDYRIIKYWSLIPEKKKVCGKCGKKVTVEDAEIHHKNKKRYDNRPENLEIFHKPCHRGGNSNNESMIGISIRMPASLLKKIEERAKKLGISTSEHVRYVLKDYS